MCVNCVCVSAVDAGSVAGAERSGGARLSDPGAQPARAAEQGCSGRPTVWLHHPNDELHPAGKSQECALKTVDFQEIRYRMFLGLLWCNKEVGNMTFWFSLWLLLLINFYHCLPPSIVLFKYFNVCISITLLFLSSGLLTYGWTWYCCCPAAIGHRILSG